MTVRSATYDYTAIPHKEGASSTVGTNTVHIYPIRGDMIKDAKGLVAEATHMLPFPYTSTVSVGHRIYEAGASDYYEVLFVKEYEDHKEVLAKLVENR